MIRAFLFTKATVAMLFFAVYKTNCFAGGDYRALISSMQFKKTCAEHGLCNQLR